MRPQWVKQKSTEVCAALWHMLSSCFSHVLCRSNVKEHVESGEETYMEDYVFVLGGRNSIEDAPLLGVLENFDK